MKKYLIAYSMFRMLDILTTVIGVSFLGCWESNPFMRILLGVGLWHFVFVNVVVSIVVGYCVGKNLRIRAIRVAFLLFIILNGIIVIGNIAAILIAIYLK